MELNKESIYWLFSSSAQTISAFVAFLITGFALVLTMMDSLQEKDETLEEIHDQLKRNHYKWIKRLAIITGVAIVSSLTMVYLNGIDFRFLRTAFIITSIVNIASIFGGIAFVISIINPDKYKKAAEQIIRNEKNYFEHSGKSVDQTDFMKAFILLEKEIRDVLVDKRLYVGYGDTPKMAYSFRQMVVELNRNEFITRAEQDEILKINKFRNLVFHGHLDKVDKGMIDRIEGAMNIVKRIKNNR